MDYSGEASLEVSVIVTMRTSGAWAGVAKGTVIVEEWEHLWDSGGKINISSSGFNRGGYGKLEIKDYFLLCFCFAFAWSPEVKLIGRLIFDL